jgi:ubiquinone/menaquinone biosynthesis C-methylase UbiE
MVAEARRKLPPELTGRLRFELADASALPYADGSFDLVAHSNMIPFFDEAARVLTPGGFVLFAFSSGSETPIYVSDERLRTQLERRGFTDFAEFSTGRGTSFLARKPQAS